MAEKSMSESLDDARDAVSRIRESRDKSVLELAVSQLARQLDAIRDEHALRIGAVESSAGLALRVEALERDFISLARRGAARTMEDFHARLAEIESLIGLTKCPSERPLFILEERLRALELSCRRGSAAAHERMDRIARLVVQLTNSGEGYSIDSTVTLPGGGSIHPEDVIHLPGEATGSPETAEAPNPRPEGHSYPLVTLRRFLYAPWGTFGMLTCPAWFDELGWEAFYTVEAPWAENRELASCIPEGEYLVYRSWFHRKNYEALELAHVPGRSEILLHGANWPDQVRGCIGPGVRLATADRGLMVTDSRATLSQLCGWAKSLPEGETVEGHPARFRLRVTHTREMESALSWGLPGTDPGVSGS